MVLNKFVLSSLIIFLISSLSFKTHAITWSNFRKNNLNQANVDLNLKNFKITQKRGLKVLSTNGLIWATAVFDNEKIYIGSADKKLYTYDHQGNFLWDYEINQAADALIDSASLITPDGQIIIPGGDGYLHSVDKDTGLKNWVFKASASNDDTHQSGVIVNSFEGNVTQGPDGTIYAGSDNGYMYALNLDGTLKWKYKTNMMIWSSPAISNDNEWMIFGSLDNYIYLLNPKTGSLLDRKKLSGEVKSSPVIVNENEIYVGSSSGKIYKLQVSKTNRSYKLQKKWFYKAKGEVYSSPVYQNEKVYVGSLDGNLYALSKDGQLIWKYNTFSKISSSPFISKDGVLIFGAKNSKIYALDSQTGERIWSYRTSLSNIKSNLDASPVITPEGIIINGSYSGKIYLLPYELCLKGNSKRCEYGGFKDIPHYIEQLPNGVNFLYQDSRGNLHVEVPKLVGLSDILRLKMIVKKENQWISNAAINPLRLKVKLNGKKIPFRVSSDGSYLNLYPEVLWDEATHYKLEVHGSYFKKTHWFLDRFKYLFLEKFNSNFKFTTEEISSSADWSKRLYEQKGALGVDSMFLFQPSSLETYIPAALDGQFFQIIPFELDNELIANNEGDARFIVFPSFKSENTFSIMREPSKVFLLKGRIKGNNLTLNGKFKISAMGGTIPFDFAKFNAQINEQNDSRGEMFFQSNCLKIKGNGSNFTFPITVVENTCDHKLRLIGVGTFKAHLLKTRTKTELKYNLKDGEFNILNLNDVESKMLSIIYYSKNGLKVISQVLDGKSSNIKLPDFIKLESIFVDTYRIK